MKKFIIKRKTLNGKNVEFIIQRFNLCGDNKFYSQSQKPFNDSERCRNYFFIKQNEEVGLK